MTLGTCLLAEKYSYILKAGTFNVQKREPHKVISFQRIQTKTENTSSSILQKNKEESEQVTESRMEETTSSLPSKIRGQLLLGADKDMYQPTHSYRYLVVRQPAL